MTKKDYLSGVFRDGIFNVYGLIGDYKVKQFDYGSNEDARKMANNRKEVHGTYKDGVFRPADLNSREGFANNIEVDGRKYAIDHLGQMYDQRGNVIAKISVDGKILSGNQYKNQRPLEDENEREDNKQRRNPSRQDVEWRIENEERREKTINDGNQDYAARMSPELTGLAEYISRSNEVLGNFRSSEKSYGSKNKKIRVYEAEIPGYQPRTGFFSAWNAETKDGKEQIILVDRRLKPHEKIATITHEMSHIYGQKSPYLSRKELAREEHDAQLAAINHLASLYENYDSLAGEAHFDVEMIPKREIGKATKHLVMTKEGFGVRQEEISKNQNTFKKIHQDLESMLRAVIAIPSLILSMSFLSKSFTGNVISNTSTEIISFLGIGLFALGMLSAYSYFKAKADDWTN